MRKLILLAVCTVALTNAACNTIAGVGRDVSAAGSAVTQASKDVSR